MAKQLTAPGCAYTIVARVDTTIYSPDQKWTLDVPAGQHDFIAETNEIIIPADAMFVRKSELVDKDLERVNVLGKGSGSLATFVTRAAEQIVGKGNILVKLNNDTATLTVAVALDTTESQLADVQTLLDRVLPRNLVTEFDPFPSNLTRLEYLESTGTQWVGVEKGYTKNTRFGFSFIPTDLYHMNYFAGRNENECARVLILNGVIGVGKVPDTAVTGFPSEIAAYQIEVDVSNHKGTITRDGETKTKNLGSIPFTAKSLVFFAGQGTVESTLENGASYRGKCRMWGIFVDLNNEKTHDFIPALDPTGTPCMFDTMTRKAYYNRGTGDFLYPGKETQATTYSLRNRMYAQLTEHGVRRLYHVPKGYNGSKEEYAAEHGFKLLIETPQPEEGYWTPVWHDREDCIELEWVKTEPPTEEVTENA